MKVAIFTEGQTEQIFVCEAVRQLANDKSYYIVNETKNGSGDRMIKMDAGKIGDPDNYHIYVQICNCASDSQVLSTVREEYDSLLVAGFDHIIAIRDLYPHSKDKLPKILAAIDKFSPQGTVIPLFVVAVAEIEAWFVAENEHFTKIHPDLNPARIFEHSGIDITINSENFEHPSEVVDLAYKVVGKNYSKDRATVTQTVSALDMIEYFLSAGDRAQTAKPLMNRLQQIFA